MSRRSSRTLLQQMVRGFHDNSLKLLLETPANVRDLLGLTDDTVVPRLDLGRLVRERTTFVARDFRHVEADVVLRVPLLETDPRRQRLVWIYLLLEHQSKPDRLMPLRVLDYVVQIFKAQMRGLGRGRSLPENVQLQPVLPIVFYTGVRRWESPGRLMDLVQGGELFAGRLPACDPLYLNLGEVAASRLEGGAGWFGWVLRLLQGRAVPSPEFRALLERVVGSLESMPAQERGRWQELLTYIHALVYHERVGREVRLCQEVIQASVSAGARRQEVQVMGKTMAELLVAKGRREERQKGLQVLRRTLLGQLRTRFGEVPPDTVAAVEGSLEVAQLGAWLDQVLTATSLEDIGITPSR
jgi:hypothetical protein